MTLERSVRLEARTDSLENIIAWVDPVPQAMRLRDEDNLNIVIAAAKKCSTCPLEQACKPSYRNEVSGLTRGLRLVVRGILTGSPKCLLSSESLKVKHLDNRDHIKAIRKLGLGKISSIAQPAP
jgi:hypothetical protein